MKIISYGGGVQSTAMIVLAVQGRITGVDAAVFCNVGDDSEDPLTITYVREVMQPWAAAHNFPVLEIAKTLRDGTVDTLWNRLMKEDSRFLGIPVRMNTTGAPGNRSCTADYKIKVIGKYLKQHGATPANPATVCIGFSTDEIHRANRKKAMPYESPEYPLLELGLDRGACQTLIADAGLPVPPKSSCFFCPYHRRLAWAEMRRDRPELFAKCVELETTLNVRRAALGRDPVWLTDRLAPIDKAIPAAGPTLFDEMEYNGGQCDEGACWT